MAKAIVGPSRRQRIREVALGVARANRSKTYSVSAFAESLGENVNTVAKELRKLEAEGLLKITILGQRKLRVFGLESVSPSNIVRAAVLRKVNGEQRATFFVNQLADELEMPRGFAAKVLTNMEREGLIAVKRKNVYINGTTRNRIFFAHISNAQAFLAEEYERPSDTTKRISGASLFASLNQMFKKGTV